MKKKTLTLKEASERAASFPNEKVISIIGKTGITPKKPRILRWDYMKNGKGHVRFHCPSCGHEWETQTQSYSTICPRCSLSANVMTDSRSGSEYAPTFNECVRPSWYEKPDSKEWPYAVVLDIDRDCGYLLLGLVEPEYVYRRKNDDIQECLDQGNYDFLDGQWELNPKACTVEKIVFIEDKGFRLLNQRKFSPANSTENVMASLLSETKAVGDRIDELCDYASFLTGNECDAENVLLSLAERSFELIKSAKRTSAREDIEGKLSAYQGRDITPEEIRMLEQREGTSYGIVLDTYADTRRVMAYCGKCGQTSTFTEPGNGYRTHHVCEHCGDMMDVEFGYGGMNGFLFEVMEDTGYLVERIFRIQEIFTDPAEGMKHEVSEETRVFYTDKKPYYFRKARNGWERFSAGQFWTTSYDRTIQSNEEIMDVIKKSVMKYSGLEYAWGLNGSQAIEPVGKYGSDSYAYKWYRNPCVEKTIKVGLRRATSDIIRIPGNSQVADPKGKSVCDVLGINMPVLKISEELNLGLSDICLCSRMYRLDNSITADEYREINNIGQPGQFINVSEEYHAPIKRILRYLNSCYDEQCIDKKDALITWNDYLRMADELGYDLRDKSRKYPDSLKKEHDRAEFAYRKVKDDVSRERFHRQYEKNKRLEYSKDGFMIKIPEEAEEIVAEATNQKNCVASYVTRVCQGETVVAFLRRKDHPDDSYVTMEILNGQIYQVKGYANEPVNDSKTVKFIRDFAEDKGLVMNYR